MANEYLYKPDIIKIRGVHGTNEGDNQEADIGFPMVGMHTLFENAVVKAYDGDYTDTKKLAYKREGETTYTDIENQAHFNCIKDGYNLTGLDKGASYWIKSGNTYIYHTAVGNDASWEDKWNESKTIGNNTIYTGLTGNNIYIATDSSYYDKQPNGDYKKATVSTYNLYEENTGIDWEKKYKSSLIKINETYAIKWVLIDDNSKYATSGIYALKKDDTLTWIRSLTFEDGETDGNPVTDMIRLCDSLDDLGNFYYKSSNGKMTQLTETETSIDISKGLYKRATTPATWTHPNTNLPDAKYTIADSNGLIKDSDKFTMYSDITATANTATQYSPIAPFYEKTGVLLNYKYNDKGDILKIPFVEEDREIDNILTICNLDDRLAKYVHLTNLTYVE